MPSLFLSPSTQDGNPYIIGGSEEQYMNLVADAMEPYLRANGIYFVRNDPTGTVRDSINQSNAGNYDLHLALHSNAAGAANAGRVRGTDVYYAQGSDNGQRAAFIIADNFKEIYPLPDRVRALPTTRLAEVTQTRAPAVLVEIAYHDNVEDANWIVNNIDEIARNLSQSVTTYFGLPFVEPTAQRNGRVTTSGGNLNIRATPSTDGTIIGSAPNGAIVQVRGRYEDWYVVDYNGLLGYVNANYITVV
jgi:N-acetylmuramoyl-L-alanine amidase